MNHKTSFVTMGGGLRFLESHCLKVNLVYFDLVRQ